MFKRAPILLFLVILAGLIGCGGDNSTSNNTPPPPAVGAPTISAFAPDHVIAGQHDVSGTITGTNFSGNVVVNMGAGITVTQTQVASTTTINVKFDVSSTAPGGSRTISVTAQGGSVNSNKVVTVDGRAPRAEFAVQASKNDPAKFTFNATDSSTSTGHVSKFLWEFGDRKKDEGKVVTHQFGKDGIFSVTLTVVNSFGLKDEAQKKVEVKTNNGGGGGGGIDCGKEAFVPEPNEPDATACFGFGALQKFVITKVDFPVIQSDHALHTCGGRVGEIRRQFGGGVHEFLGDVKQLSCGGRVVTLKVYGLPNYDPPKVGEHVYLVYK